MRAKEHFFRVIIVVAAAVICFIVFRNKMLANTMRLLRVQGTVNLEDSKGASKPVIENLRFQSGDALSTGSDGLASVGMDDSKIVTLQNDSRAEFRRKNKQLELKLTKGAVFFNVTLINAYISVFRYSKITKDNRSVFGRYHCSCNTRSFKLAFLCIIV